MAEPLTDAQIQQMLMSFLTQKQEREREQSALDAARGEAVSRWMSDPWLGGKPGAQTYSVPNQSDGMGTRAEAAAYHSAEAEAREAAERRQAFDAAVDALLKRTARDTLLREDEGASWAPPPFPRRSQ